MEVLYNRLALAAPLVAVVAAIVILAVTHADPGGAVVSGLVALAGVMASSIFGAVSQQAHLASPHPPDEPPRA